MLCFEIIFSTIEHVRFASLDSQLNINLPRFASIFKFFNINMFASLWNQFSNYRRSLLRFDIEKNIIIKAFDCFALLRFDIHAIKGTWQWGRFSGVIVIVNYIPGLFFAKERKKENIVGVRFASKIICLLSDMFTSLRKLFSYYQRCSLCFKNNFLSI